MTEPVEPKALPYSRGPCAWCGEPIRDDQPCVVEPPERREFHEWCWGLHLSQSLDAERLARQSAERDVHKAVAKQLASEAKLAEALEALGEYGVHDDECILARWCEGRPTADGGYETRYGDKWYRSRPVDETPDCTCGFSAARRALSESGGKAVTDEPKALPYSEPRPEMTDEEMISRLRESIRDGGKPLPQTLSHVLDKWDAERLARQSAERRLQIEADRYQSLGVELDAAEARATEAERRIGEAMLVATFGAPVEPEAEEQSDDAPDLRTAFVWGWIQGAGRVGKVLASAEVVRPKPAEGETLEDTIHRTNFEKLEARFERKNDALAAQVQDLREALSKLVDALDKRSSEGDGMFFRRLPWIDQLIEPARAALAATEPQPQEEDPK